MNARRDILKFGAGAAVGVALTPAPWRVLGDSAIWSQNWSWMPRVPRGERASKDVVCSLCPAGCVLRAQCVEDMPVAMFPAEKRVCPAGIVGHHVALHPLRLRQTIHRGAASKNADARAAAAQHARGGGLALLDLLPGRGVSRLHRAAVTDFGGTYLEPPRVEGATSFTYSRLVGLPGEARMELSEAKTVLSLSTPVLEGWAGPEFRHGRSFRLIHADPRESGTAERADAWLKIQPHGEPALLLGLIHALQEQGMNLPQLPGAEEIRQMVRSAAPERLAERAGVPAELIQATARSLRETPVLVVADGDPMGGPLERKTVDLAAALNVILGQQAFRRVPAPAASTPWDEVPDGSIRLLLIDEPSPGLTFPWSLVERKLARAGHMVVALTWNRQSFVSEADWLVPVPVYLEGKHEAPPSHDTAARAAVISEGWMKAPEDASTVSDFIAAVTGKAVEEPEASPSPAGTTLPSATRLLMPGAASPAAIIESALQPPKERQLLAYGWRQASVSPLLGKLWVEAELQKGPGMYDVHPEGWTELCAGPAYARDCRVEPSGAWRSAAREVNV